MGEGENIFESLQEQISLLKTRYPDGYVFDSAFLETVSHGLLQGETKDTASKQQSKDA